MKKKAKKLTARQARQPAELFVPSFTKADYQELRDAGWLPILRWAHTDFAFTNRKKLYSTDEAQRKARKAAGVKA